MVRHGKLETEQGDDGADQSSVCVGPGGRLTAASAPSQSPGPDSSAGRLAWSRGPGFSFPSHDRSVGEPYRQAAAPAQGRIVGSRVRGAMTLFWDVVATLGIGFGRHDNNPGQ
jgi:hypothetical protein